MLHIIPPIALLQASTKLPGAILSEPPREVTITPRGKEVNLEEEMGMSISVPRNATVEDERINLTTTFSGANEMPAGVEPVSPDYSIETSKKVEFHEEVEVKLQHNAKDCKDMAVYESRQVASEFGKFEEVDKSKVKFGPRWAMLKVKSLVSSVFKIGKKKDKYKSKGECWWGRKHHPLVLYCNRGGEVLLSKAVQGSGWAASDGCVLCVP